MKKALIVLIFCLMSLTHAHAAEITGNHECWGGSPCTYLNGEIKSGDLIKLKSLFDSPARRRQFIPVPFDPPIEVFYLKLNSRGGSMEEAIEIGRWIRKNRISTTMSGNAECFGSCVYILAAGVTKQLISEFFRNRVGIHRPYLTQMPREGVQFAIKKALADSKAYFAEMNIPEQLADTMFSIPPDKMEILTDDKLSFYRLTGWDIVFEEELELKAASLYGVTRQEYMQNKKLFEEETKKKCFPLGGDDGSKCIQSTAKKYGLHESQMKKSR